MKLVSLAKRNVNPSAEIDVYDPNHYCAKCNKTMKNKTQYMYHLRMIHGIKPPRKAIVNPKATIDKDDPNLYCAQCEKHFSSRRAFKNHLSRIHQMA